MPLKSYCHFLAYIKFKTIKQFKKKSLEYDLTTNKIIKSLP